MKLETLEKVVVYFGLVVWFGGWIALGYLSYLTGNPFWGIYYLAWMLVIHLFVVERILKVKAEVEES